MDSEYCSQRTNHAFKTQHTEKNILLFYIRYCPSKIEDIQQIRYFSAPRLSVDSGRSSGSGDVCGGRASKYDKIMSEIDTRYNFKNCTDIQNMAENQNIRVHTAVDSVSRNIARVYCEHGFLPGDGILHNIVLSPLLTKLKQGMRDVRSVSEGRSVSLINRIPEDKFFNRHNSESFIAIKNYLIDMVSNDSITLESIFTSEEMSEHIEHSLYKTFRETYEILREPVRSYDATFKAGHNCVCSEKIISIRVINIKIVKNNGTKEKKITISNSAEIPHSCKRFI